MPVRLEIREGESLAEALQRLRGAVFHSYKRQWHKTLPGCYEKPSYRRRQRRALDARNRFLMSRTRGLRYTVYFGLAGLLSRKSSTERWLWKRFHRLKHDKTAREERNNDRHGHLLE
jgi:hypothetical protein